MVNGTAGMQESRSGASAMDRTGIVGAAIQREDGAGATAYAS